MNAPFNDPRNRDANDDFVEHGAASVQAALDRARPTKGYDFDDMAREQGGEAIRATLAKPKRKPAYLSGISAAALAAMKFEPIRYIVPGYVAEGLTLLAGAPKIGKSWLALNLAVAIASGQPAFGSIALASGDVFYAALEDNNRRVRKRLIHMNQGTPERLTFVTEWPTMDEGCVDELEAWVQAVPDPRLIVIDVLSKVRGQARGTEAAYDGDYRALTGLQRLASQYGLAIIVVHHTRKMDAEDPFDSVSGTRGLTGAADTVLVLKRDTGTDRVGQATLYGRGRDIEEIETAVLFERDSGTWRIIGAAIEVAKTVGRQAILDCLQESAVPLSAKEISDVLGKGYAAVRQTISRMIKAGEIERRGQGQYTCLTRHTVTDDEDDHAPETRVTGVTGYKEADEGLTADDMEGL